MDIDGDDLFDKSILMYCMSLFVISSIVLIPALGLCLNITLSKLSSVKLCAKKIIKI
jgi:hypothetical protein